jgi:23S rRNA (adenine2503-C2)-methyltransferase
MKFFQLKDILQNEPAYRLEQVKKAVFVDLIKNWDEATTLPFELRERLNKEFPLEINAEVFESKDGKTVKALIELDDELKIESVLMKYVEKKELDSRLRGNDKEGCGNEKETNIDKEKEKKLRNTICVSSQVGCALGCDFCATGKMGFKRNLSVDEIIEQVIFFARCLLGEGKKITNIVFMGMGEPFLNYDNVLAAIKILNDQKGFSLGARHFSISSAGIIEGIEKLANEELQINLAISLHAANDNLRTQIMPINKKYPLKEILIAVDKYIEKTNRKVMFEYIMIDGINDGDEQAKDLAMLMRKPLYFVNLIPCNPVGQFRPAEQEKIERFKEILKKEGAQVNQRYSFGQDILAACGQLAG